MKSEVHVGTKQLVLFAGVIALLIGVAVCGKAGRMRDGEQQTKGTVPLAGYLFALAAGVMSAVFNIGYAMALPISDTGVGIGLSRFAATNCIWLLMLGAGSIPNIVYCMLLMYRNRTAQLLHAPASWSSWGRSSWSSNWATGSTTWCRVRDRTGSGSSAGGVASRSRLPPSRSSR